MPKQLFEINGFHLGIMSNPEDELDIPNDSATYSLNVDPLNEGELKGIPDNEYLKDTGFNTSFSNVLYYKPVAFDYSPANTETAALNNPSGD
jgi:hypothetical protein